MKQMPRVMLGVANMKIKRETINGYFVKHETFLFVLDVNETDFILFESR